jgi:sn-glycerol 3-phosphate transport system substrate-binding protein
MDGKPALARKALFLTAGLALLIALAACGGDEEDGGGESTPSPVAGTTTPSGGTATPSTGTATPSGGTIEITVWHHEVASNLDTIQNLSRRFNNSQSEVKVKLAFQGSIGDHVIKVLASAQGGDLPTIDYMDEVYAQRLIDTGAFRPVQDFVDQEGYDLSSDFDPKVIQYYTVDGKLWAMPIAIAVPLLFYNKIPFREAGLDPENPPQDLDEVMEASRKLVKRDSHGNVMRAGFALDVDSWRAEVTLAEHGDLFLNNGNGRDARATEVSFNGPTGQALFRWWQDMIKEGLAINVGRNPSGADNLLPLGSGQIVMTWASSAALRSVVDILGGGLTQTPVDLGIAGAPGVPGGTRQTATYSRGLWLAKDRPQAEQEAAWKFIKWLMEPEQQAEWFAGTGYLPVRNSSYDLPAAQEIMARYPGFRVAKDMFQASPVTPATLGPLLGPFVEVRDVVCDAIEAIVLQDKDPKEALDDAAEEANQIIEDYNERVE